MDEEIRISYFRASCAAGHNSLSYLQEGDKVDCIPGMYLLST